MAGKLKIVILVVLGLVSFGASYFIFGYLRPEPAPVGQLDGDARLYALCRRKAGLPDHDGRLARAAQDARIRAG